jgi:hypothetical protein
MVALGDAYAKEAKWANVALCARTGPEGVRRGATIAACWTAVCARTGAATPDGGAEWPGCVANTVAWATPPLAKTIAVSASATRSPGRTK